MKTRTTKTTVAATAAMAAGTDTKMTETAAGVVVLLLWTPKSSAKSPAGVEGLRTEAVQDATGETTATAGITHLATGAAVLNARAADAALLLWPLKSNAKLPALAGAPPTNLVTHTNGTP